MEIQTVNLSRSTDTHDRHAGRMHQEKGESSPMTPRARPPSGIEGFFPTLLAIQSEIHRQAAPPGFFATLEAIQGLLHKQAAPPPEVSV